MRKEWMCSAVIALAAVLFEGQCCAADAGSMPQLRAAGAGKQLIVDGKPFIALSGEVHNSTGSSPAYMAPIWDKLKADNLNTVITPAYWDLLEPDEGRFDFTAVDDQIRQARAHGMRIVLLWFGALKNAGSSYAPGWVRRDTTRFPRAVINASGASGLRGVAPLSIFGEAIAVSDSRAFARLMEHIAQIDAQHTVITVQVENETGLLGDSRDRSPTAEAAWRGLVPAALLKYLQVHRGNLAPSLEDIWRRGGSRMAGTWTQVFGDDWQAEEIFMAWGVSRFVDRVAAAGKQKLALPMYANAWLGPQKLGDIAGAYPSGGPIPRVFDVWKAGAPHIDWIAPDIYSGEFERVAREYTAGGNPLFIPETALNVGNLFLALGNHGAMAFAPFGIEDNPAGHQVAEAYGQLNGMIELIAAAQSQGRIKGFAVGPNDSVEAFLGGYAMSVQSGRAARRRFLLDIGVVLPADNAQAMQNPSQSFDSRGSGIVLQVNPGEFIIVGKDLSVVFRRKDSSVVEEIDWVQEGRFVDGKWIAGRSLNGDERLELLPFERVGTVRVKMLNPQ